MFGFLRDYGIDAMVNYNDLDSRNTSWIMGRALDRESRLNADELKAKEEALLECEFGPKWWLRAHP